MFELPDFVDAEAWNGYVEMRMKLKKPLTERAMRMALRKLEDFRDQGQCPNAVLDQSTFHDWLGLYPVQDRAPSKPGKAQLSADDREYYKKLGLLQ